MNSKDPFRRSSGEKPSDGLSRGQRSEPTLEQARMELAEAITSISSRWVSNDYGPLTQVISATTIVEILKSLEANLSQFKGDLTLILEEIYERLVQGIKK